MKTESVAKQKNQDGETKVFGTITLQRAKEIIKEEGIEYTDDELGEVLHLVSKVITITTCHYERKKQSETKIISINTNTTHETTSLSLYPREYRRAS